jgi:tetratricopeptide (TPR) repeat protein
VAAVGFAAGVLILAGTASLAFPALAEKYTRAGVDVWRDDLQLAYARLDRASSLNPLAGGPLLVKGSIALRAKDLDEAETAFLEALGREPESWYANLQLALVAAARGETDEAWARLRRAQELNPNDKVARRLQTLLERGKPVDPDELNDRYVRSFNQRQVGALRSPIDGVG